MGHLFLYLISCSFSDYLKVADENKVEVGRFCGELTGEEAVVGGSRALLTFYSNGWTEKRGFFVNFTFSKPCKCPKRAASCYGGLRYANVSLTQM